MKKKLALLCTAVLAFGLLAGCGGAKEEAKQPETSTETPSAGAEQGQYKDGNYFAKGTPDDKGWMYMVKLEVKDGKITAVNWDGANTKTAGDTKKQLSESGKYGMKAGGAQSEWHEQAKKMEDALIEKQDPKAIAVKEGKTDAVSGVSIHVGDFVTLADQALAAGPVEAGQFKDGGYHAEGADFDDKGWKETVDVTVFNGQVVAANWDNINKDGKETKKQQSVAGTYGMNWHEQAKKMEDELIAKQDPAALVVKEDGTQDAVSGVSIHVGGFVKLAQEALASAK
ncbi:FMN-binding protein [Paenibacillus sp. ACRRX]|uniref:FMN-binding protein n=1 Tax=unclassified Paenibacillus TaxID=185978 RepID=UPI001EF65179|nr:MULTISPECIES: FMN-binding protein [unclassified Paenibacillus]MCG7408117.1 FMN-binding protein [Paenibacillus sp. ACRRX]MDK8181500.1 FMN-binding protein [Paenibacillus sp. UMB4589-SE434]